MWIIFSLIAAVADASRMAVNKHLSIKKDPSSIFYLMLLYGMPFVAIMAYFTFDKLPFGNPYFAVPAILGALIMALGSLLLAKASNRCDVSIVAPIIGLTPILVVPIEYVLLGTLPNIYGLGGIILVVFGSYILNFSQIKSRGIFGPFKVLFKLNGGLLPLIVAIIFSIGATANKYALQFTDSFSYATWVLMGTFLVATVYLFGIRSRVGKNKFRLDTSLIAKPSWSIFQGLLFVAMVYSELYAASLISAAYMIALKRLAALFGVAFGYFIFKEEKIRERAIGAIIMVVGAIVLVMFGK
ncbi:MAG: DMT family transporter [Candidatus Omnitrophota bacterium]